MKNLKELTNLSQLLSLYNVSPGALLTKPIIELLKLEKISKIIEFNNYSNTACSTINQVPKQHIYMLFKHF